MQTYDEIYERMKGKYTELTGADIDDAGDLAIRLKVLAGEIYNAEVNANWLKNQMFADTATGEFLDKLAAERGLTRKKATKATGKVKFTPVAVTSHNIVIPKGTVVATDDKDPVRFVTTSIAILVANASLVYVSVEAEVAGARGNVLTPNVKILVDAPTEIGEVSQNANMTGGSDEETDEELRARIKATYTSRPNGTNLSFYKQLALTVDGVAKAGVVPKLRGAGTVNVYVCGNSGAVADTVITKLQKLFNESRELNVDVLVAKAAYVNYNLDVKITAKIGYNSVEVKRLCKAAFESYINSLDMGGKLYLSALGKCLIDTGCVENYEFDTLMDNKKIAGSQCFAVGEVNITVV